LKKGRAFLHLDMNRELDTIIEKYADKAGAAIPLLQELQALEGYVNKDSLRYVSERTGIPAAELWGIATFYSMFRLEAQGKHLIRICKGTACHVSGADNMASAIRTHLKLKDGEMTTENRRFTLMEVACLGCCSLAPVMMIDDTTYGNLNVGKIAKILDSYQ
jgi:NADH:ubiquinone oxidoreductase subunit E